MSRNPISNRKSAVTEKPKKINKFTNTTPELFICGNCQKRQSEPSPESKNILKDYAKSINYINSCHNIINQMILEKTPSPVLTMPDLPNFISIFTALSPKPPKSKHELDNIESIDELYSQLNCIDLIQETNKNINYEKIENKPIEFSSEDEKLLETSNTELVKEREKKMRNSSIPRPVSSDKSKMVRNNEDVKGLQKRTSRTQTSLNLKNRSQTVIARQRFLEERHSVNELKSGRNNPKNTLSEATYSRQDTCKMEEECRVLNCEDTSEHDLNQFTQQLLESGSASQCSTPRTVSSTSGSPRQRSRKSHSAKITYKTRSEHSLKVSSKLKGKSIGNKIIEKGIKRRTVTICDSNNQIENVVKSPRKVKSNPRSPRRRDDKSSPRRREEKTSPRRRDEKPSPRRREPSPRLEDRRKVKSQSMLNTGKQMLIKNNDIAVHQTNYDDSDIEPDTQATLDFLRSIQNTYPPISQATPQYVVKQKPLDLFMQRRKQDAHSDSEIEIERNHDQIVSESEVDEDVFIEQNFEEKYIMRANNPLNARILPKSILSNIGILTQAGKVKPEKELEMQKLKNSRAQDKQNSSFRQPRVRDNFNDDILKIPKRNSSSDIRTDDENPIELECITKKYRSYY